MYLTAVDLSLRRMSPPRSWQGRGWDERLWHKFFCPFSGARVLSPAWECARPGHGGKYDPPLGTPTNPALAPSLYPESNGQKYVWQVQWKGCWLQLGVCGASGHCCALGILSTCYMGILPPGHCLEDSGAWAALLCSHPLPSCPGGHRQRSQPREETLVEAAAWRQLLLLGPTLVLFLPPHPGVQPRGT